MTKSVEICKQLGSLHLIDVKLKSKRNFRKLLECAIFLRINANCLFVVVLQCTMVFNVKTVSTREIKTANRKSFLDVFNLGRIVS